MPLMLPEVPPHQMQQSRGPLSLSLRVHPPYYTELLTGALLETTMARPLSQVSPTSLSPYLLEGV
jgi:hypothetical protein